MRGLLIALTVGTLALLGSLFGPVTVLVSACTIGTPDCPYPPPRPLVVVGPHLSPLSLVAPVAVLIALIVFIEWRRNTKKEASR